MCKRKNSETATTLHEQCTPKRPRWLRVSFSKSSAPSCTPFLHSSLSTHLAKPEPPSSLTDHHHASETPHRHEDINNTKHEETEEFFQDQDSESDQFSESYPSSPESSTSSVSSIDSEDDLDDLIDDELIAEDEASSPSGLKMLLIPNLSYRPYSSKIVLSTISSTSSEHDDTTSHGRNLHHPDSRRSRHHATSQNHGWDPKSGDAGSNDVSSITLGAPTAAAADTAVQMWVCCACESDNGGDVVWCSNKTCSHYTVNCLDCFSY